MEVAQGEAAVRAEDRPAAGTERPSQQLDRLRVRRRHRKLVGIGRLAAHAVRPPGPELVSRTLELVEDLDAAGGRDGQAFVELGELQPEQVTVRLELHPSLLRDALVAAEGTGAALPVAARRATDDRYRLSVWIVGHGTSLR
jgi:hypothetical protein